MLARSGVNLRYAKSKRTLAKMRGMADKFMRLRREARISLANLTDLARRLAIFAIKFSLNLRLIKFGRTLARFGRCGFINLTVLGLCRL